MIQILYRMNWIVFLIFYAVFLAACVLPATERWEKHFTLFGSANQEYFEKSGARCLLMGWAELAEVSNGRIAGLTWLANPMALAASIFLWIRVPSVAAIFGLNSILLASFYLISPLGTATHPDIPRIGAWVWLSSFIGLTVGSIICLIVFRLPSVQNYRPRSKGNFYVQKPPK